MLGPTKINISPLVLMVISILGVEMRAEQSSHNGTRAYVQCGTAPGNEGE
jgi:hypothetical protein